MGDGAALADADRAGGAADSASALVRVLVRALRALGEAGQPATASRLAADGWAAIRHEHSDAAEHLTGVLHYLARLPTRQLGESAMSDDVLLDVRTEIPARRHELIFDTYFALPEGASFVLVNDHDPKPLYYQFAAEHAGQFSWDYLEQGPQTWRVRIGRTPGTAS